MENYMETCNDDFCVTLETTIDIIPPKITLLQYNVSVMGDDSTSPSSNANSPTYIFNKGFVFSIFYRLMHYKLVAMGDSSSIYI